MKLRKFKLKLLHRRHRSFTLVEILLTLGIAGVIWVFISSVFLSNFKIFSDQKTAIHIANQNRLALDEITNQARQAQAVSGSCPVAVCGGDTTSSPSVLILQLWPLVGGQPTNPGSGNPDYFVYKLDPLNPTNLIRKIYPAVGSSRKASTGKIIASNVSNLTFTYLPNSTDFSKVSQVNVSLANQATSLVKILSKTQTAQARLRNVNIPNYPQYYFPYAILGYSSIGYGVNYDTGGISVGNGNFANNGTVYSNNNIDGGSQATPAIVTNGDIKAKGTASVYLTVQPTPPYAIYTCPSACQPSASFPISDSSGFLTYWKNQITSSSSQTSCPADLANPNGGADPAQYTYNCGPQLFPANTNLSFRDKNITLNVTGPIYVQGDISASADNAGQTFSLQCANGTGTVIIADGGINLGSGVQITANSSTNRFLIVSNYESIRHANPEIIARTWDAIFYAFRGSVQISGSNNNGPLTINGAIYANNIMGDRGVYLRAGAQYGILVNYPANINPATFSNCQ